MWWIVHAHLSQLLYDFPWNLQISWRYSRWTVQKESVGNENSKSSDHNSTSEFSTNDYRSHLLYLPVWSRRAYVGLTRTKTLNTLAEICHKTRFCDKCLTISLNVFRFFCLSVICPILAFISFLCDIICLLITPHFP
jgi:hypothetical protein